mmetsp:Transcript_38894/g.28764  ORF Transcript_38894/g.28764 Transcript_38894/m.28764 type:complete len:355 (+) Transcript_38894:589-1653(+)
MKRDEEMSDLSILIRCCYFVLTTLSTVGYGEMYPVSNIEKLASIVVMLFGVAIFSYIMSQFFLIIDSFQAKMGSVEKTTELQKWLLLTSNFTKTHLPKSLINQIEGHFSYYWTNDRLINLSSEDEYLKALPRSIKRQIMTDHLFRDVFVKFKTFFHTKEYKDSRVLYDIAFGFMPRYFSTSEPDLFIYEEEDEVPEMYFVLNGSIGIGYSIIARGPSQRQYRIAMKLKAPCLVCEHYVLNFVKSEFLHVVLKPVQCYALTRKFLSKHIFPKYPEISTQMKDEANIRYRRLFRKQVVEHREEFLSSMNKKSFHNTIKIQPKDILEDDEEELEIAKQKRLQHEKHTLEMTKKVEAI